MLSWSLGLLTKHLCPGPHLCVTLREVTGGAPSLFLALQVMVTSEKLSAWTYPGIQELHSKLKSLIDSLSLSPISHHAEHRSISSNIRYHLNSLSFHNVSIVLERLLDAQTELSADARITLHTTLSNANHFVAVILPLFYNRVTLLLLYDDKLHFQFKKVFYRK